MSLDIARSDLAAGSGALPSITRANRPALTPDFGRKLTKAEMARRWDSRPQLLLMGKAPD